MNDSTRAASGISYGKPHGVRHVERAVELAMAGGDLDQASSVLLFLTSNYASDPGPALRAAARTAGCTQVFGCTANGLLTDQDWALDCTGAAALVLGGGVSLIPPKSSPADLLLLSLTTPEAISAQWLDEPMTRIGAVASDEFGHGPFHVWSGSRVAADGHVDAAVAGADSFVAVAQGVRALTAPLEVADVQGFNIRRLGGYPALNVLLNALPGEVRRMERIPLHMLMCGVTFGEPSTAIRQGRFRLDHIVAANTNDDSVTLTHQLRPGERLFWAIRDALTAEREYTAAVERLAQQLTAPPLFGLLFSCLSRGPALYGNRDRDIEILRDHYPGMPFIGFYGNGEIAPLDYGSYLHQYSAVIGLFTTH
jgi:small ligand-binding sensory domain FIST